MSRRETARTSYEPPQIADSVDSCDSCPFCGSLQLIERLCKLWCANCRQLIRTCSDL